MAKNSIIQIDTNYDEEARPLTHPSRTSSSSTEPSTTKQKKTFGRNNKLLHFLVGITIFGAIIVFFPSWSIIIRPPDGGDNGSSSRINKLRTSSQDAAYSITKGGGRQQDDYDGLLKAQIPKCAEHTFLTLYERQPQQQTRGDDVVEDKTTTNNSSCKGMLLRDDIILTTHECSQSTSLFFEYTRGSRVFLEATPHTALNANMGLHSKLGFLQVKDAPWHYLFLDQSVRRARMFLSLRSHPEIADVADDDDYNNNSNKGGRSSSSSGSISPYITCKGYRPIVHNFPLPNGEMVPIGEELLTVGLPNENILWEHADLDTAPALRNDDTNERWWTNAITFEEGEATFQKYFDAPEINGPEGSLSIVRAHSGFIGKASGVCESFDPRGHRGEACFYNYVARWRDQKPFSGMHFFDWLDYGTGRSLFERNKKKNFLPDLNDDMVGQIPDEGCVKKKFNSRTVHFFNDTERQEHEIYLSPSEDGQKVIARYKQSDEVVGPSSHDHPHLYMFDLNKQMYIVDKNLWDKENYGAIKHTAVLAGRPALSAGEAYFKEDGVIWGINYSSGHYRPKVTAVAMMYQWMKDQGLNTSAFNWVARKQWSTKDCYETDWKSFEIHAFDVRVLEKTCREVTKSPTWTFKDD